MTWPLGGLCPYNSVRLWHRARQSSVAFPSRPEPLDLLKVLPLLFLHFFIGHDFGQNVPVHFAGRNWSKRKKNATCQQITFQWGLWKVQGVSFFLVACAMQEPERCTRSNLAACTLGWGPQPFACLWFFVILAPAKTKTKAILWDPTKRGFGCQFGKKLPPIFSGCCLKKHRDIPGFQKGDLNSRNAPWKLVSCHVGQHLWQQPPESLFWPSDPW